MKSDIMRTPVLKDNLKLHEDAMRVIEFYCYAHNVSYCQGMFEVLLPFLFMNFELSVAVFIFPLSFRDLSEKI